MPLASGTRLDYYQITSLIGQGRMGEVHCAKDSRLGRDIAIKVLLGHLADLQSTKRSSTRPRPSPRYSIPTSSFCMTSAGTKAPTTPSSNC